MSGRTLFAQTMDFLPWTTFDRIVRHYRGNRRVRTLRCAEQYRAMAFAQLTYRESLRDIEACLEAQAGKLYHSGFRDPVRRSTLADANEHRDWRIYADFAQRLIDRARILYADDRSLAPVLEETVYALDATTIDLCLSVFPWARFRSTKAAVKLHTLLDLQGAIPSFVHISDGKLHDVNVLDLLVPEPGAIYLMDRAYGDFLRFYRLHQAGAFFVTRAKNNLDARRVYSRQRDPANGILSDHLVRLGGTRSRKRYPEHLRRVRFRDPETNRVLVFLTNCMDFDALTICNLYRSRWHVRTVLQMDQATSAHQALLRHLGKRRQDPALDRRVRLCPGGNHPKEARTRYPTLQNATGSIRHALRKNPSKTSTWLNRTPKPYPRYR